MVLNSPVNALVLAKDTTVKFANYRAGKYFLRVIYDTNKNGVWDTGNVKEGLQPEKIYNEPKELSIRANWDRKEQFAKAGISMPAFLQKK